jgi:hypothetical protein
VPDGNLVEVVVVDVEFGTSHVGGAQTEEHGSGDPGEACEHP